MAKFSELPLASRRRVSWVASIVMGAAAVASITLLLVPSAPAAYPGPNGLIAFRAVIDDTSSGVFTIDPANPADQQLIRQFDGDVASAPHYTPDLSLFTFELDTPDSCANVITMNIDGSNVNVLPLANGDVCEASPTFSADGTRIFYEGWNGKHRDALYSMNVDGSDRRLVTACEGHGVTDPETSPDGNMLSFTCFSRSGGQALFDSRINGSRLRQLTPYSLQVGTRADWSPDSRRILFISAHDDTGQVNTATINADGTDLEWLTNNPAGGLRAYGNSYSPDGQWIVLRIEKDDGSGGIQSALFKMPANGGALKQITDYSDFRPRGMTWGSVCPCTP
jgi:Tol biopolymer transport system component